MYRRGAVKIIQTPHLPREVRLGQNPSASQSADAVHFRQTAGYNELWSEMERRARCVFVNCIQINFIYEHERADAPPDITNLAQDGFPRKGARRIVQIRDYDEARLRRDATADLGRINRPAVFLVASETLDARLQIIRDIENRAVCRMLDQNFVAGLEDCSHGEMVRHRSAFRFHNAVGIDTVMRSDRLL